MFRYAERHDNIEAIYRKPRPGGEVYNLGGAETVRVSEMVRTIEEALGRRRDAVLQARFDARLVPGGAEHETDEEGAIETNATLVAQAIRARADLKRRLIVVSVSKSGPEVAP